MQAQGINETYQLHIDNEVHQVQINAEELHIRQGEALNADVVFQTNMPSYLGLLTGQIKPGEAIPGGLVRIQGDPCPLSRFLNLCGISIRPLNMDEDHCRDVGHNVLDNLNGFIPGPPDHVGHQDTSRQ